MTFSVPKRNTGKCFERPEKDFEGDAKFCTYEKHRQMFVDCWYFQCQLKYSIFVFQNCEPRCRMDAKIFATISEELEQE